MAKFIDDFDDFGQEPQSKTNKRFSMYNQENEQEDKVYVVTSVAEENVYYYSFFERLRNGFPIFKHHITSLRVIPENSKYGGMQIKIYGIIKNGPIFENQKVVFNYYVRGGKCIVKSIVNADNNIPYRISKYGHIKDPFLEERGTTPEGGFFRPWMFVVLAAVGLLILSASIFNFMNLETLLIIAILSIMGISFFTSLSPKGKGIIFAIAAGIVLYMVAPNLFEVLLADALVLFLLYKGITMLFKAF